MFFFCFPGQNGNKYLCGAKKSEHMVLAWDTRELMRLRLNKECILLCCSTLTCLFLILIIRQFSVVSHRAVPSWCNRNKWGLNKNLLYPRGVCRFLSFLGHWHETEFIDDKSIIIHPSHLPENRNRWNNDILLPRGVAHSLFFNCRIEIWRNDRLVLWFYYFWMSPR